MQWQRILYKNILSKLQDPQIKQDYFPQEFTLFPCPNALSELEKILAFLLLAREQGALLLKIPNPKTQENFLASIQRLSNFLKQSESFIPLYLLFEQLLQEKAKDFNELIHFFDVIKNELLTFQILLQKNITNNTTTFLN